MNIEPQLFIIVVPHALILLVKPIQGAANNIILSLERSALKFYPLAMLDELKDVSSCSNSIR